MLQFTGFPVSLMHFLPCASHAVNLVHRGGQKVQCSTCITTSLQPATFENSRAGQKATTASKQCAALSTLCSFSEHKHSSIYSILYVPENNSFPLKRLGLKWRSNYQIWPGSHTSYQDWNKLESTAGKALKAITLLWQRQHTVFQWWQPSATLSPIIFQQIHTTVYSLQQ